MYTRRHWILTIFLPGFSIVHYFLLLFSGWYSVILDGSSLWGAVRRPWLPMFPNTSFYLSFVLIVLNFSLLSCRWYSIVPDGSGGDRHGLRGAVWAHEGSGPWRSWTHHPACLLSPAQWDANQDLWTSAPWIQKGTLIDKFRFKFCIYRQTRSVCV